MPIFERAAAFLKEEWRLLVTVRASDRPWQMPFAAALSSGLPLFVGAWFGRLDYGLVSALGGQVFLYLPATALHHRMAALMALAFTMTACYALGAMSHHVPALAIPVLTVLTTLVTMPLPLLPRGAARPAVLRHGGLDRALRADAGSRDPADGRPARDGHDPRRRRRLLLQPLRAAPSARPADPGAQRRLRRRRARAADHRRQRRRRHGGRPDPADGPRLLGADQLPRRHPGRLAARGVDAASPPHPRHGTRHDRRGGDPLAAARAVDDRRGDDVARLRHRDGDRAPLPPSPRSSSRR